MAIELEAAGTLWRVVRDGQAMSFGAVLRGWADEPGFRQWWTDRLREVPHEAYCWETPPLTAQTLDRTFECAFVASPLLARVDADPRPFREHFDESSAVVFPSLGRDALLVAPCPHGPVSAYAHLGRFVREGPRPQADDLWAVVAGAMRGIGGERRWLSTAGLGVSWLHVRIDARPKYYRTAELARES